MSETAIKEVLKKGELTAAIYGIGRIGLPLACIFLEAGFNVICVDKDYNKVLRINQGLLPVSYFSRLGPLIKKYVVEGKLRATANGVFAAENSDVMVVTVPVDVKISKKKIEIITKDFINTVKDVGKSLGVGNLVIIKTLVPPKTTVEVVKPILEHLSGLRVEYEFGLAYAVERLDQLTAPTKRRVQVVGGYGPNSSRLAKTIYEEVFKSKVITLPSPTLAEFVYLVESLYYDVNMALANEIAQLLPEFNINVKDLISVLRDAIKLDMPMPKAGFGGPKIPKSTCILIGEAEKRGLVLDLALTSRVINDSALNYLVFLVKEAAERLGISLKEARIAILGDAYREDIASPEDSPTHRLVELLLKEHVKKRNIIVHDPHVAEDPALKVELTMNLAMALKNADIVIVMVGHSVYRDVSISAIKALSGKRKIAVVDGANALKKETLTHGVIYVGLGTPWYEM
ncbi:MAG: hypothetical protein DRO23_09725 [Thermoprotei archaeon]|nr:MAG: hypothetical protein DRO23_09725 [Thermoprotei archaeon]